MSDVIFSQEPNCYRDSCEGCPKTRRDMDLFGLALLRKTKLRGGGILCELLDPRVVKYVAPKVIK